MIGFSNRCSAPAAVKDRSRVLQFVRRDSEGFQVSRGADRCPLTDHAAAKMLHNHSRTERAVRSGGGQRRRMMDFYEGFDVSLEATNV
ncbi:hypothetical protein ABIC01_005763 [Bradyrhizobium sp. RT4b]